MTGFAPFTRADRLGGIELSEIVAISEAARALKAAGRDVVALSTGEPDFPVPAHVIAAMTEAAEAGQTKYPPTGGTLPLRDAVAEVHGVARENVIIATGAKLVLANAFLASLNAGDEVILPTPYWTSYRDQVRMAEGMAVEISCGMETGFKLTPEKLAAAITPRSKWLLLNSPSNPSGAVYSADELKALAEVLADHPHIWVMADEIYQHLSFVPFTSFRDAAPDLADRMLIINGVSKAYSMTGFRLGWGVGPVELVRAMTAVQGQLTSGASSLSQAAALAALTGPQELLAERRAAFQARRDKVVARLTATGVIDCPVPEGAFYAFPSVARFMDAAGLQDDAAVCRLLLENHNVALVPGRAFGAPGHVRLSFAYSDQELDTALARIANACAAVA